MIDAMQQLSNPAFGVAAALGFLVGTAARTANHLGRKHR